jgi:hypothetical protein
MSVQVKRIEYEANEPGGHPASSEYQLGDTIEGVWVPFVTKSGSYIDHLVALGKEAGKAEKASA